MPMFYNDIQGLTEAQVNESKKKYGTNRLEYRKKNGLSGSRQRARQGTHGHFVRW